MTAPDPAKESRVLMLIKGRLHFLDGRAAQSLEHVPSLQGLAGGRLGWEWGNLEKAKTSWAVP